MAMPLKFAFTDNFFLKLYPFDKSCGIVGGDGVVLDIFGNDRVCADRRIFADRDARHYRQAIPI